MPSGNKKFNWQMYFGIVLLVTGVVFLVDQLVGVPLLGRFWPLLIVLYGLTFFIGMLSAEKRGAGLAIPGTLVTVLGFLLFIQNTFNLWVTWAYAWTLLIVAAGLGMLIMNIYLKRIGVQRTGGILIGIGLTLFVVFGVLFEIIFNISGTNVNSSLFLGAGLVLLGLFVALSRSIFKISTRDMTATESEPDYKSDHNIVSADYRDVESEPEKTAQSVDRISALGEFYAVHFKSIGELRISQGDSCSFEIQGAENLRKKIKTEIRDGVLYITYHTKIGDWTDFDWITGEHRIYYNISMKSIKQIVHQGAGNILSEVLAGDNLNLHHQGAGKIEIKDLRYKSLEVNLRGVGEIVLQGVVESQTVDLSGAGSFHAERLKSQMAEIILSGAGSAKVWVESELHTSVTGVGSVKYKGQPKVQKQNTGFGSVEPM